MSHVRYAIHPRDFRTYSTASIRENFLIEELFVDDEVTTTYSLYDRLIVGGVKPLTKDILLKTNDQLKAEYFLQRREIGIINVGAPAAVTVDGTTYFLQYKEALYIGQGIRNVIFHPAANGQAYMYFNSSPAHMTYPTKHITHKEAEVVVLGATETSNHRTIRKLIVNSILKTCQLQMGLTELNKGSVWNTMPAHTHNRRMEAYFYFEVPENQLVCHFMGEPDETRHIWMKNNQAVLSPPWSIHSGAGTFNYSFIWGMAGENLDYGDMDIIEARELR